MVKYHKFTILFIFFLSILSFFVSADAPIIDSGKTTPIIFFFIALIFISIYIAINCFSSSKDKPFLFTIGVIFSCITIFFINMMSYYIWAFSIGEPYADVSKVFFIVLTIVDSASFLIMFVAIVYSFYEWIKSLGKIGDEDEPNKTN